MDRQARGIGNRSSGEWARAAEVYEQGLAVEDLVEELCRRLMTCQVRLGRAADTLATYDRCRTALAGALGVPPSAATEAVRRAAAARP